MHWAVMTTPSKQMQIVYITKFLDIWTFHISSAEMLGRCQKSLSQKNSQVYASHLQVNNGEDKSPEGHCPIDRYVLAKVSALVCENGSPVNS